MYVLKRNGSQQEVDLNKITARIANLCSGPGGELDVDPITIAQKVVSGLYSGVTTTQLDELAAETAASSSILHPDYSVLAARISVSNLHKKTPATFSAAIEQLHSYIHPKTGAPAGLISDQVYAIVMEHREQLDAAIVTERDFEYDYFGFKTLQRSYLLKCNGEIVERPSYMLMRVAVGVHKADIEAALRTYTAMSKRLYTLATPSLFNAGTRRPQMSSCFLLKMEDSLTDIYATLGQCAQISKNAGGIGIAIQDIRASGSYISGTGGESNGIVPMARVFNATSRFVDQGGGKRAGSIALYLAPYHADIFDFLDLRKNSGNELQRARDLFTALWVSDLFMKRVESGGDWTLLCPHECTGLSDVYGDEFEALYTQYEQAGKGRRAVKAQDLWNAIVTSQIETGTPYLLYKDAVNHKSNQKNVGVIHSSNLCAEIVQYTSHEEIAVCNLASINLAAFVKLSDGSAPPEFDFDSLRQVARLAVVDLNRVIDGNYYPTPEAETSNLRHRPVGLGVQALADTFMLMRYPFDSPEAAELNEHIFEAIYYGAVQESVQQARELGAYSTFEGSPFSQGQLQYHLWGEAPSSGRFDWPALLQEVQLHGMRNSLLTAQMPTASTSQILGNVESVEQFTSNLYVRRTSSGEFIQLNKHLVRDLIKQGLWTEDLRNQLMADGGSVQQLDIPDNLKELYKTMWELSMRTIIDQSAARSKYIDQSSSMNLYVAEPTLDRVSSMLFYGWKKGLKTGIYYMRTRPRADAIAFSVDKAAADKSRAAAMKRGAIQSGAVCTRENRECAVCSA